MHQYISPLAYQEYITTLFPEYQHFLESAAALLLRSVPADSTVVDLGCGTGNLAEKLGKESPFLIGFDHDPVSLAYARGRKLPKTSWHYGELPNFEFPPARAYHASLALHHLNGNWQEVFHRIHAALPEGGIFVQTEMVRAETPAEQEKVFQELQRRLEPKYSFPEWKAASDEVDHFHTLEEELSLLRKIGFEITLVKAAPPVYQYLAIKHVQVR